MDSRSATDPRAARGPRASLTVHAESGTALTVLDHEYREVARAFTSLHVALAPGLYKLLARAGLAVHEEVIELLADVPTVVRVPPLALRTAAPLVGGAWSPSSHLDGAAVESRRVSVRQGSGSSIFAFVRLGDHSEHEGAARPWSGISLHDEQGNLLVELESAGRSVGGVDGAWGACRIDVAPGAYRLRVRTERLGSIEQSVVASPDWQTQVFLQKDRMSRPGREGAWEAVPTETAIFMAPLRDGFDPSRGDFRLTEIARRAVEGRETGAVRAISSEIDSLGRVTPMLRLLCVTSERHDDVASPPDVARTLRVLESELGGHPDVAVLSWAAERGRAGSVRRPWKVRVPPMLAGTWALVVAYDAAGWNLVPRGSVAASAASHLVEGRPWVLWLAESLREARMDRPSGEFGVGRSAGQVTPRPWSPRRVLRSAGPLFGLRPGGGPAGTPAPPSSAQRLSVIAMATLTKAQQAELTDTEEALVLWLQPRRRVGPAASSAGEGLGGTVPSIQDVATAFGLPVAAAEELVWDVYTKLIKP